MERLNLDHFGQNVAIAGNYVEACITELQTKARVGRDTRVDVYLLHRTGDEAACHQSIVDYIVRFPLSLSRLYRSKDSVGIISGKYHIRLIPKRDTTFSKVIADFDLGCIAAYYDGHALHVEQRARHAWTTSVNVFSPDRITADYSQHIRAYACRGYDFLIPFAAFTKDDNDEIPKCRLVTPGKGIANTFMDILTTGIYFRRTTASIHTAKADIDVSKILPKSTIMAAARGNSIPICIASRIYRGTESYCPSDGSP